MLNVFIAVAALSVSNAHSHPTQQLALTESWYGPAEIRFTLPNITDPYDPDKTDVRVRFEGPGGRLSRFAFFDGTNFRARLLAPAPGSYIPHILLNGHELPIHPQAVSITQKNPLSFVRLDPAGGAFLLGDGSRFWPLGHDLAWGDQQHPLEDYFPLMHGVGLNWARIWNTYWDGRCPYWATGKKLGPYELDQAALTRWDTIVRTAEEYDIKFQWVLHHHGQVSTKVNPNWGDHPWNIKNGGWLKSAEDFFTDPEAKKRTKAMIRYLIARYSDSPSIMAWELFNEVQFSDAAQNNHWPIVGAWHDEMAKYVRAIDPYHHLITTSSEQSAPIWAETDYRQDHGYPSNLESLLMASKGSDKQPYFYGEIGIDGGKATPAREQGAVRDGIWSGILAGHAGSGQYWAWDAMLPMQLYSEYRRDTKVLSLIDYLHQVPMKPLKLGIKASLGGVLSVGPGRGWAKSDKQDFLWPVEADSGSMGLLSTFLQGSAHQDMGRNDIKIAFNAPKAGTFGVTVGEISAGGATLLITLDGQSVTDRLYSPNTHPQQEIKFPFTAGRHTVVLKNTGADWVTLTHFNVTGIAPAVIGEAASSPGMVLLRLHSQSTNPTFSLSGLGLPDGPVKIRVFDLDSGGAYDETATSTADVLNTFPLHGSDVIVSIRK